jgi:hypothetical protein
MRYRGRRTPRAAEKKYPVLLASIITSVPAKEIIALGRFKAGVY